MAKFRNFTAANPDMILSAYFAGRISKNIAYQEFNRIQDNKITDNAGKNWLRWNMRQRSPDIAGPSGPDATPFADLPEYWFDPEEEMAAAETDAGTVVSASADDTDDSLGIDESVEIIEAGGDDETEGETVDRPGRLSGNVLETLISKLVPSYDPDINESEVRDFVTYATDPEFRESAGDVAKYYPWDEANYVGQVGEMFSTWDKTGRPSYADGNGSDPILDVLSTVPATTTVAATGAGLDIEELFKDVNTSGQDYVSKDISKERYARAINAQVQSRNITPFQGNFLAEQFPQLFGTYQLFAKPTSEDLMTFQPFMEFLKGGLPAVSDVHTRARGIAQYLAQSDKDNTPPVLVGAGFDPQLWESEYLQDADKSKNLVMDVAMAGVHPLYREGRKRALEALFLELGGREAQMTGGASGGQYPFFAEAVRRGYFGQKPPVDPPPGVGPGAASSTSNIGGNPYAHP
jgi:hypothetical protein